MKRRYRRIAILAGLVAIGTAWSRSRVPSQQQRSMNLPRRRRIYRRRFFQL